MAEIWGAAIMVVGSVASAQAAKKKEAAARKENRVDTKQEAKYSALLSQFEREQDYYYNQLEKQEKSRGLDQFKKFSGMSRIDPTYVNTSGGIVLPDKPDINKLFPDDPVVQKKKKKKGGLRGFISKVDPLGSKLIDIDPLSSSVLGKSEETVVVPQQSTAATLVTPGG